MAGISVENAHNCIAGLEIETAIFCDYDRHGGGEVVSYSATYFSDIIKEQ